MHEPVELLESALDRLVFICKSQGLEDSKAFQMALVQIDLAVQKLREQQSALTMETSARAAAAIRKQEGKADGT